MFKFKNFYPASQLHQKAMMAMLILECTYCKLLGRNKPRLTSHASLTKHTSMSSLSYLRHVLSKTSYLRHPAGTGYTRFAQKFRPKLRNLKWGQLGIYWDSNLSHSFYGLSTKHKEKVHKIIIVSKAKLTCIMYSRLQSMFVYHVWFDICHSIVFYDTWRKQN